jgi:myo-inositol 2-dehydrogenase / D-chiro-inositol 1-dehydrogenase
MDALRIGLIGAGVIGAAHSAVLQQISRALAARVQLIAVADPLAERRNLFRDLYGYQQLFADAHDLIARAEIDTLFVCTPTRYHAEIVRAAAARGLHVFCEKPLAMSYREGCTMVEAVQRAGVHSQIGLVLRYSAVYTVMRELVRAPGNGQPTAVVFRDDQCFPIRGVHDSAWRADRALTAGGTLIEHGVHDLDLLTWFFGPVARLRAWEHNRAGYPGVEDYMAVELQFASGLHAQLVNVWHNMVQRPSNRRLEIFCENAFVASEADMSGDVTYQLGDGPEHVLPADEVLQRFVAAQAYVPDTLRDCYGVSYLVQDLAFVEALLAERDATPDMRVGLEAQRLAAATYHAARSGEEVDVANFQPTDVQEE